MSTTVWRFEAMDTLFFRDGRPMNAGESAWVDSIFPPSGQSLQGAIRTAILNHQRVSIEAFQSGTLGRLNEQIGDRSSLGKMNLTGGFLENRNELLFPVPLDLVKTEMHQYALLKPLEQATTCDLGHVQLPGIACPGFKPMDEKFVALATMEKMLSGDLGDLTNEHLIALISEPGEGNEGLCDREYRVGLARNNQTRTAKESMLYAIGPLRPRKNIRIAVQVDGIDFEIQPRNCFLQKLGGEGKIAHVEISKNALDLPKVPPLRMDHNIVRFKLVFVTPAKMPDNGWLPDKFTATNDPDRPVRWEGNLGNCELAIISACIGKPIRIGGWNLAERRPEDLQAFVPAGSVYFCEAKCDQLNSVQMLHGSKLGEKTEYGYGQVLIGSW